MGRLKNTFFHKIKASSLTEVIVATSILLLVFAIALLTLNNVMMSTLQKDTQSMDTEIEKLIYQYKNQQLKAPLSYTEDDNTITIEEIIIDGNKFIEFSIKDEIRDKTRAKKIIVTSNES
ncbi:hypothetical protein [Polaribacter porphyrae]|uniref:Type II secretion system protein n=1 Tax=Polaribacter porphyrae TaxID=1137780 RepID=A0A2S7WRR1_9FLAO|nr:hypothetical protein [Polaribacter porphyrae]PQJ80287.1 hypothetical protein BTO18_14355 [Polaribacter porphyrae]